MKNKNLRIKKGITAVVISLMVLTIVSLDLPLGWFKAGSSPDSYEMGIDKGAGQEGNNAATIKSLQNQINGFGL